MVETATPVTTPALQLTWLCGSSTLFFADNPPLVPVRVARWADGWHALISDRPQGPPHETAEAAQSYVEGWLAEQAALLLALLSGGSKVDEVYWVPDGRSTFDLHLPLVSAQVELIANHEWQPYVNHCTAGPAHRTPEEAQDAVLTHVRQEWIALGKALYKQVSNG